MSKFLLVTVIIVSFLSCNQAKQESEKKKIEDDELAKAILKAESSSIIETKTFLGFKFGMTENEVSKHISKLRKEGKVYVNKSDNFQYDFNYNGIEIFLNFFPEFHDGKLYKMTYPTSSWVGSSKDHIFLMAAFNDTKDGFESFINEDLMGEKYFTNIKNNLIVTFKNSRMIYENAPISKLVKLKEEEIEIEKSKSSSSEF